MGNSRFDDPVELSGESLSSRPVEARYLVDEKCFVLVLPGLPPGAVLSPHGFQIRLPADYIRMLAKHLDDHPETEAVVEWIH
jgi:hypothetical protein